MKCDLSYTSVAVYALSVWYIRFRVSCVYDRAYTPCLLSSFPVEIGKGVVDLKLGGKIQKPRV